MDRVEVPEDMGYCWHCPDCATLLKEADEKCLCEVEPVPRDGEDPDAAFRRRRMERREKEHREQERAQERRLGLR